MIETEQTVTIRAGIDAVWAFARDIRGWASLMPGMQDCEVVDEDNSRWTLKVGVGGLVRTVRAQVHVEAWGGPERVSFTYKLEGDPVQGAGAYHAIAVTPDETEVTLRVEVKGEGPMAPMWEAMGRPLLPQLAKSFAGQLRDRIEEQVGDGQANVAARRRAPPTGLPNVINWIRAVWLGLFGRSGQS